MFLISSILLQWAATRFNWNCTMLLHFSIECGELSKLVYIKATVELHDAVELLPGEG